MNRTVAGSCQEMLPMGDGGPEPTVHKCRLERMHEDMHECQCGATWWAGEPCDCGC